MPGLKYVQQRIQTKHLASVGQAQAAAELTERLMIREHCGRRSNPHYRSRDRADVRSPISEVFRPYRLTCADLNPVFLARLRERLVHRGLEAEIREDDIERTVLASAPDLLLSTLLLEHIEWRHGVDAFAPLRPRACGIVLQQNPPQMSTAVTPGRRLPPSIARAVEIAHPTLVSRDDLIAAMRAEELRLPGNRRPGTDG